MLTPNFNPTQVIRKAGNGTKGNAGYGFLNQKIDCISPSCPSIEANPLTKENRKQFISYLKNKHIEYDILNRKVNWKELDEIKKDADFLQKVNSCLKGEDFIGIDKHTGKYCILENSMSIDTSSDCNIIELGKIVQAAEAIEGSPLFPLKELANIVCRFLRFYGKVGLIDIGDYGRKDTVEYFLDYEFFEGILYDKSVSTDNLKKYLLSDDERDKEKFAEIVTEFGLLIDSMGYFFDEKRFIKYLEYFFHIENEISHAIGFLNRTPLRRNERSLLLKDIKNIEKDLPQPEPLFTVMKECLYNKVKEPFSVFYDSFDCLVSDMSSEEIPKGRANERSIGELLQYYSQNYDCGYFFFPELMFALVYENDIYVDIVDCQMNNELSMGLAGAFFRSSVQSIVDITGSNTYLPNKNSRGRKLKLIHDFNRFISLCNKAFH